MTLYRVLQATVQMESTITCRKRKADDDMDKLSEPVIVEYNNENMQIKVEKVLGHIVWLLRRGLWTIHKVLSNRGR
ncbi:hypothetical protein RIR_jg18858.t1 [Rhizophagus irregularis DAOM 181602=DAOM 197198]|uniref:Uncharacterized protein n=1 Tax=Rhizophagus irregularis (strain DAOM 181602 / DAOM 197198 / MUCL 43194) TaxID=747089 RepID=U9T8Q3_RHIID|nr:hypothetical protein RIR_jg18858.t1 [Rhizophagus irregularis DAOM 181602=DAOM 197198]